MSKSSRSRWSAIGAAVAVALGAGGLTIASGAATPSSFVPIAAERILDTRTGIGLSGPFVAPVGRTLQVSGAITLASGSATVVPSGATAVLLTVTVVNPQAAGFVSVRAGDVTGPASTSNLNFAAGETTANAVTVVLAANGTINIVHDALGSVGPSTDILVDVTGYYLAAGGSATTNYGYIYNQTSQNVALEAAVLFGVNGPLLGTTHTPGTAGLTVVNAGTYKIQFTVASVEPNQFAVYVNGVQLPGALFGSGAGTQQNSGQVIATLAAGAVITLVNHTSAASVTLQTLAGGSATNVNASILVEQLG